MTKGQTTQKQATLLLKMLASFQATSQDNGAEKKREQIATAAEALSKLLDDEVLIFEDDDQGGYDYCTGHSYHHGWGQTLLVKQVIFSSYEGWY